LSTPYESVGLFIGNIGGVQPTRDRSNKEYMPISECPCEIYSPFLSGGATDCHGIKNSNSLYSPISMTMFTYCDVQTRM